MSGHPANFSCLYAKKAGFQYPKDLLAWLLLCHTSPAAEFQPSLPLGAQHFEIISQKSRRSGHKGISRRGAPGSPHSVLMCASKPHKMCFIAYLHSPSFKLQPLLLATPLSARLKSPKMSPSRCYQLPSAITASQQIKGIFQSLFYTP